MNAKGYEEYLLLRRSVEALVSEHEKLRQLVTDLENDLSAARSQLAEKDEEVKELQTRYERAKFSGAILGGGGDAAMARKRVGELVREIDKCIALLDR
jgi:predicted  nucleic acid-binding Zn-ribbon protein